MHAGIAELQWRVKCSRHFRRMRNPRFCVSGKRPMASNMCPRQCSHFPMPPLCFGDYVYANKTIDYWFSLLVPHCIIFRIGHSYGKIDRRGNISISVGINTERQACDCVHIPASRGTTSMAFMSANSRWYLQECGIHIGILPPWGYLNRNVTGLHTVAGSEDVGLISVWW